MSETTVTNPVAPAPASVTITPAASDFTFTAQGRHFWVGVIDPGPVPAVEGGPWICWGEEVNNVWTVGTTAALIAANLSGVFPGANGTVAAFFVNLAKILDSAFSSILPPMAPPVQTDAQKITAAFQAGYMGATVAANGTVSFTASTAIPD
jgi:hypothetical protein